MTGEPAFVRNLKSFTRGDLAYAELEQLEQELYGANDRATAVLFSTIVESSLSSLLKARLCVLPASDEKRMFGFNGSVGSFSAMTDMAYAVGAIGPISKGDLYLIRTLRNEFAHSKKHFTFDTQEVKAVCDELKLPDHPEMLIPFRFLYQTHDGDEDAATDMTQPKNRYIASCHTLSTKMLIGVRAINRISRDDTGMP